MPEWDESDILKTEKELLGFYVTGHPLGQHSSLIRSISSTTVIGMKDAEDNDPIRIGGLINLVETKISKKDGMPWAVIYLEGLDGTVECLCFSKKYAEFGPGGNQRGSRRVGRVRGSARFGRVGQAHRIAGDAD